MDIKSRIERIQKQLGVSVDGVIGVETVSALERVLGIVKPDAEAPSGHKGLVLSRRGIDKLIAFEISSESYYTAKLSAPTWPGGASGATIGIGYDLGYRTKAQIKADWSAHLPESQVAHLMSAANIRGADARGATQALKQAGVRVPLAAAMAVFSATTLPEFAALTLKTYPGTNKLPADAQSALVSLVYNRGAKLTGNTRVEMANLAPLVKSGDLAGIAREISAMKRLWVGKNLDGLLKRRDDEAALVRGSNRAYDPAELVYV